MTPRNRYLALAALIAFSGACDCNPAPVRENLKPEGVACEDDAECETGLCDALPGASKLCIRKCTDGCLSNEMCTPLTIDRYACVPEKSGLCSPCTQDADCPYPGDKCIQISGVNVCGRDCSFDSKCPDSFTCGGAVGVNGDLLTTQCVPQSGTCDCTAASHGQTVPCESTNNIGTCMGVKTCSAQSGYSACSARTPSTEVCNGIDDDCNGSTDEDLGQTSCGVGECAVTVDNCVNGEEQTCTPKGPATEVCDEKDNDCDEVVDNGFDKQSSLQHCGACNAVCAPANAVPVCTGGMCGFSMCNSGFGDADGIASNGCECAKTNGGVEICDGIDNDCNGVKDDGFDLTTNPLHCGSCNNDCNTKWNPGVTPHATPACSAGVCVVGTCDPGYGDCNQQFQDGCEVNTNTSVAHCGGCGNACNPANASPLCTVGSCEGVCNANYGNCDTLWSTGCEVNLTNDAMHCGACNNACSFPNATGACTNSACVMTCNPNYWDIDKNPANGCEYNCVFQSSTDLPDLSFVDANCDGIDGEVANAIFVAPPVSGGNDTLNPGTKTQPKATIGGGLAAAVATGKRDVYVATGTFVEQVAITAPNKGVYGGYQTGSWSRSTSNNVTVTGVNTPLLIDNAGGATVQLMIFLGANASGPSATAYGAFIRNSAGVTLNGLTVKAGDGTNGTNGTTALPGANGSNGFTGQPGCEDSGGFCTSCGQPQGGSGGGSTCGRSGGKGGNAAKGGAAGQYGSSGVGGTPGGVGVPAGWGNWTPGPPYVGGTGATGSQGTNGAPGSNFGTAQAAGYVVAVTTDGATGGDGAGGGGGGGGGGGTADCDSYGGGGGGGGGGGCGGQGGKRGTSGGASIAIYLYNSTVTGDSVSVVAGNGGAGGNGTLGGNGGNGGFPGGTSPYGGGTEQDDGSNGAAGGKGGNGGPGGAGGAGGGGPSVGVVRGGSSSWNPVGGSSITAGVGGIGGTSPAGPGQSGISQQLWP